MKKLLLITKLGLFSIIFVLGVNGCQKNPVQVKSIGTIKSDKVVQFEVEKLTSKKIDNLNLVDFSSKIMELSHLDKYDSYGQCPVPDVRGVKVTKKREGYLIEYLNGRYYCNLGHTVATKISYLFKTKYQDSKIIFNYPKSYKHSVGETLFGEHEQFDTTSKLERDIQNIYQNLHKITIDKVYNFSGEIDTKYPDKSIYANFKRFLGNYDYIINPEEIDELKKRNTFSLEFKDRSYPLYVEVVPYRNGSKVTYSTEFYYSVSTDGKSSFSKNDILELHKKVQKIIEN